MSGSAASGSSAVAAMGIASVTHQTSGEPVRSPDPLQAQREHQTQNQANSLPELTH
jgi:hypothetical protein